jgi:putative component of toxin-antitoxin plasmid stabilization module
MEKNRDWEERERDENGRENVGMQVERLESGNLLPDAKL